MQEIELQDDPDNKIEPVRLLRMMRTAVLREHHSVLPLLCSFGACDELQPDQLASLLKEALRRGNITAAQILLDFAAVQQMYCHDIEQMLQQAVLITGPTGHGADEQKRARGVAAVAEQIASLPGVAQLSSERLAAVLPAVVQRQAVLARSAQKELNRRSRYGETSEQPLWTPLDGTVDVLCDAS
jgi:hypothetical protein